MTITDGQAVDDSGQTTYTVTLQSYLVDFVTNRLAIEVFVTPPNRPVDTLWVVDDEVASPLWRPSRMYSTAQLSAALAGAAAFIEQSETLPYQVASFPVEFVPVQTDVELPPTE